MANLPDAKDRILQAAKKIFADKSFDGSRIDDIACKANVPKSLIYYHFKSKDDILEILISNFLYEYHIVMHDTENGSHSSKLTNLEQGLSDNYSKFVQKNVDMIKIILIESLKSNHASSIIFKVVEEMVDSDSEELKAQDSYNRQERLIAEFFTNIMPLYSYFCFQKEWCAHFDISTVDMHRAFLSILSETHGAYHKKYI